MAGKEEIIDTFVNVPVGAPDPTAAYLFPGLVERWKAAGTPEGLIGQMDEIGVAKAVLVSGWGPEDSISWVKEALRKYPDRFVASHIVDPKLGLKTIQLIDDLVRNEGYRMIRMFGFHSQVPYGHQFCYPIYAKCAELGAALALNVGIAGPLVPSAEAQDPMPLDMICAHFPELKLIMAHGGEPWVDLCAKLLLKWPNLYYMTSAFAPKYYPKAIVDFMNTRGQDKIMFASDHPIIPFDRCINELSLVPFRNDVIRRKFVYENAQKLLFS